MRHKIAGKKLGRNHHQRQALFRTQARSMFTHGRIRTTQAKAKALIPLIEKLTRLCQKTDLNSRRRLFAIFQDRQFVKNIAKAINLSFIDRHSNFTKISRLKHRLGDNALIVKLEFTRPYRLEAQPATKETKKDDKKSAPRQKKEPIVNTKK